LGRGKYLTSDRESNPDDAADAWVLSTLPRALAFAVGLVSDRAAAEDVVHDCYCRLLRKADAYDLPRDGAKLLFRAITNACVDLSRRRGLTTSYDQWNESAPSADLPDPAADEPWRQLERRELEDAIGRGLDQLPLPQRAALELKSMGQSLQEIGEALGVTANNAGVLVHRARQTLARHVAPYVGPGGE
jgi:RNA polymerase sigma factor (sigma-70 family)